MFVFLSRNCQNRSTVGKVENCFVIHSLLRFIELNKISYLNTLLCFLLTFIVLFFLIICDVFDHIFDAVDISYIILRR